MCNLLFAMNGNIDKKWKWWWTLDIPRQYYPIVVWSGTPFVYIIFTRIPLDMNRDADLGLLRIRDMNE